MNGAAAMAAAAPRTAPTGFSCACAGTAASIAAPATLPAIIIENLRLRFFCIFSLLKLHEANARLRSWLHGTAIVGPEEAQLYARFRRITPCGCRMAGSAGVR